MKKTILVVITLAIFGLYFNPATATTTLPGTVKVNTVTLNNFQADFKEATHVKWTISNYCQQVDFVLDGRPVSAFYNFDGTFLGLTHNTDAKTVTAKAMQQIERNYKGYTVNKVIVLQTGEDAGNNASEVAYFADLTNTNGKELLVRITPYANVEFFQQIR